MSLLGRFSGPSCVVKTTGTVRSARHESYPRNTRRRASNEGTESVSGAEGLGAEQNTKELVIKPRPTTRRAGEPPKPVEIERTSSFLIRKSEQERRQKYNHSSAVPERPRQHRSLTTDDLDFSDNPVGWVLRKTDESLDAMESNIPEDAKDAITYVTGNLGTKASQVAVDAAKLAAKGGAQIAKVAVPAGTWALSKGFGALISVASSAAKAKAKQQKKNRGN